MTFYFFNISRISFRYMELYLYVSNSNGYEAIEDILVRQL